MSPALPIRAIIFDLGRVLVDFDHRRAANRIAAYTDKNGEEIYRLFFDSELTASFEAGTIAPQEFFSRVKTALAARLDYDDFLPIWNEIFFLTDQNRSVQALVRELESRYRLALVSNINELHFEYLKKSFPLFAPFHYIVTSFEAGCTKPDPRIYRRALELLGSLPEETFYTDDRAELVDAACGLGIRGFVFTGPEQLARDLERAGVSRSGKK